MSQSHRLLVPAVQSVAREYDQANALISTHRANIAALSKQERYEQSLADPSIVHQMPMKSGGRWSIADEYGDVQSQPRDTGIFWQAADNNELGTRNRINEYLRFDPERIHPVTREAGSAQLCFVKGNESYPPMLGLEVTSLRKAPVPDQDARSREDEYFWKKDQELIEKMRRNAVLRVLVQGMRHQPSRRTQRQSRSRHRSPSDCDWRMGNQMSRLRSRRQLQRRRQGMTRMLIEKTEHQT